MLPRFPHPANIRYVFAKQQHPEHYVKMHRFVNTRFIRVDGGLKLAIWVSPLAPMVAYRLKVGRLSIIDTTTAPLHYWICFLKANFSGL